MLSGFALPDKDHWNVPPIAFLQSGIFVDIHLVQDGPEFPQNGGDRRFRFLTEMAPRARVKRDVMRPTARQPQIFPGIAHGLGFEYFIKGPECG